MIEDARGVTVTTADSRALESYEGALRAFQTYRGDPIAPLDEALALDPGFATAAVAKALILQTFYERRFAAQAMATLEAHGPALARGTDRERELASAARQFATGDWHRGISTLEHVLVAHPRDVLALQVAHLMDFLRGDSANLRNRISRVLPHWSPDVPGFAYVLGMHAFGLEECNQYPEAEASGRRALELARDDCWAVHAVAHVMEMQGRIDEGADWLVQRRADWDTPDNGFAFHNAWHLALFHLDRADQAGALEVFDDKLAGAGAMALSRVDATALLWRLRLEGADVGSRFEAVADDWEREFDAEGGYYAFNDFHAAMAFAATGRRAALARLRVVLEIAASRGDDNGEMTRSVGREACEAAIDHCEGRFAQAAQRLAGVRDIASRFGGSHAQRDLLTLTLIDAAARAGERQRAAHFVAERLVHKPRSAWGHRLLARVGAAHA